MGFDAGKAAPDDERRWDFRPYVEAHGVISEPSIEVLEEFQRSLLALADELRAEAPKPAGTEPEETPADRTFVEVFDSASKTSQRSLDLIASVCSGQPSREQIDALPGRLQQSFAGFVVGLFGPNLWGAATSGSVETPTSGA